MKNKWFTIFIIILVMFAYIRQPIQNPLTIQEKDDTHAVMKQVKDYVSEFTTDPGKGGQSINQAPTMEKKDGSLVEDKALMIVYKLLHTKIGKRIAENLLSDPELRKENKSVDGKPNLYRNNSIIEIKTGEGSSAECGDIVEINYATRLVNGEIIEDSLANKKPVIFQLGDQKVIRGIEYALIGMREGGARRLVVPPRYAYQSDKVGGNEFITIDVELLKLTQTNKDIKDKIRVFQKKQLDESGAAALCGHPVYFTYKITTTKDKLIAKSDKPVSFILGSADVPSALNKAFAEVLSPAQYTIIIPGNLLNKKISFLPANVKLPSSEMLVIDIQTIK